MRLQTHTMNYTPNPNGRLSLSPSEPVTADRSSGDVVDQSSGLHNTLVPWTDRLQFGGAIGVAGATIASIGASEIVFPMCTPLPFLAGVGAAVVLASSDFCRAPFDDYSKPGGVEALQKRKTVRVLAGMAIGLGVSAAFAAGRLLGPCGILGAAGVAAVAGASLTGVHFD
jgi:hypothetical protein